VHDLADDAAEVTMRSPRCSDASSCVPLLLARWGRISMK